MQPPSENSFLGGFDVCVQDEIGEEKLFSRRVLPVQ